MDKKQTVTGQFPLEFFYVLNNDTMAVNTRAVKRIDEAAYTLKSNPAMAYSAVRRAAEWHEEYKWRIVLKSR